MTVSFSTFVKCLKTSVILQNDWICEAESKLPKGNQISEKINLGSESMFWLIVKMLVP